MAQLSNTTQLQLSLDEMDYGSKLERYKHSYNLLPRNHRGVITIKELENMIHSVGGNPAKEDLKDIFRDSDVDGNGEIGFQDFCFVMARYEYEEEHKISEFFKTFDTERDTIKSELLNVINKSDFQSDEEILMQALGEELCTRNNITGPGKE